VQPAATRPQNISDHGRQLDVCLFQNSLNALDTSNDLGQLLATCRPNNSPGMKKTNSRGGAWARADFANNATGTGSSNVASWLLSDKNSIGNTRLWSASIALCASPGRQWGIKQ
jgi:hypothetical protein